MGVEFTAILGHSLHPNDLVKLPSLFDNDADLRRALQAMHEAPIGAGRFTRAPRSDQWRWDIEAPTAETLERKWEEGEWLSLQLDTAILLLAPTCCSFWHIHSWGAFLTFPEITTAMREVVRRLVTLLAAPNRAIYVPDSTYCPSRAEAMLDLPLDVIEARLREECGPPARHLGDIYEEQGEVFNADGYFIDDFEDLSS